MVDRCMRSDSTRCDPSPITLDLWSRVIQLGSQLQESFLTHLSTIRISLIMLWLCVDHMIQQGVCPWGFHIQTHWQSRHTGKIQTH